MDQSFDIIQEALLVIPKIQRVANCKFVIKYIDGWQVKVNGQTFSEFDLGKALARSIKYANEEFKLIEPSSPTQK